MTRSIRLKLIAFVAVTLVTLVYGATQFFDVVGLVRQPDRVEVLFSDPGGIYERADVELLGTRVGSVVEVLPGPGTASTVVINLRHDAAVPADVRAEVSSKSAIGEQYVAFTPLSAGGPTLEDGDVVPLEDTQAPPDLAALIANLDALAGSVDPADLDVLLTEAAAGLEGIGPVLGSALDDTDQLTASALANVDALTALIDDAQRVLDTQADLSGATTSGQADLADLTTGLRELDGSFDELFRNGTAAGRDLDGLLRENREALPVLLGDLVALTDVAAARVPHLRKGLVVFPYILQQNIQTLRHCDTLDPVTGDPVESTCHYDEDGNPVYSAHIAIVNPTFPAAPPCTKGYESAERYTPDGRPADGTGPRQRDDAPVSGNLSCTASPYDPSGPNVRGFQNIERGSDAGWLMSRYLED